jgi:hypothetical protein
MVIFLEKARQLLPVLGSDVLTPIAESPGQGASRLTTGLKGISATGQRTPNGFVVFKGSRAIGTNRPSASPWTIEIRDMLLREGKLVPDGPDWKFSEDVEFTSPSAAGAVIHGGNVNGLIVWKGPAGKALKDIEAT